MQIITDTRETLPLSFRIGGALTEVVFEKLEVGDYRARYKDGTHSDTVFERKSLGDLYGTMTSGYDRFRNEMFRARSLGDSGVFILGGGFGISSLEV